LPTWSSRHRSGRNLAQRRKSELRGAIQLAFPRHSPDRSRNEIGASVLQRTRISGRGTNDRNTDKGEVGGSSPPRPTINPRCLCGHSRFCPLAHCRPKSHLPTICQLYDWPDGTTLRALKQATCHVEERGRQCKTMQGRARTGKAFLLSLRGRRFSWLVG
jgi:hypothetical protein